MVKYFCEVCVALGGQRVYFANSTNMRAHADLHRSQIQVVESMGFFGRCFPNYKKKQLRPKKQRIGNSQKKKAPQRAFQGPSLPKTPQDDNKVTKLCKWLADKMSKNGNILCQKCEKSIKITFNWKRGQCRYYNPMVFHVARIHLKKRLFDCRLCDEGFKSYNSVIKHILMQHKRRASGNYVDHRMKYEDEMADLISKCFGPGQVKDKK